MILLFSFDYVPPPLHSSTPFLLPLHLSLTPLPHFLPNHGGGGVTWRQSPLTDRQCAAVTPPYTVQTSETLVATSLSPLKILSYWHTALQTEDGRFSLSLSNKKRCCLPCPQPEKPGLHLKCHFNTILIFQMSFQTSQK